MSPVLTFLLEIASALQAFCGSTKFWDDSISEKYLQNFNRHCFESADDFGPYAHFNNINSPNSRT